MNLMKGRILTQQTHYLSQIKYKVRLAGGQHHDLKAFRGLVFLLKLNLKLR